MENTKSTWFRRFIDISVIGMLIFFFGPYLLYFLPYEDDVASDEIVALNEMIDETLEAMEPGFQDLYFNQTELDQYNFTFLDVPEEISTIDNYRESVKGIVYISTDDAYGGVIGAGSILTSDGVILTNAHVIEGAEKVVVATSDGEIYEVTHVLSSNSWLDIAFLKIDAVNLQPLPIGDSGAVVIGEETLAIGHPEGFINSLSLGNISGVRDYFSQDSGVELQITNPISAGNSGGAVLNTRGEIIGIPSSSLEYEGNTVQVQNINFAIPINVALEALNNR